MNNGVNLTRLRDLRYARGPALWINLITLYRTVAFPVLLVLIFTNRWDWFKWLLPLSFFTDSIDGFLSRGYKVTSVLGTRLDSIGDDLTVLAAVIAIVKAHSAFLLQEWVAFAIPLGLFFIQTAYAFRRYGRITSFHTYLAKAAAVLQAGFFCSLFLLPEPWYTWFYIAAVVTTVELVEEIMLTYLLPTWQTNVHGLYWVLRDRRRNEAPPATPFP
jgi:cardiolipin synthase